ncbi:MAG: DUF3151 family protein [Nitriliruptoraceae bacterium]
MSQLPMSDRHETVLPAPDGDVMRRLDAAAAASDHDRRAAIAAVVADHPTLLEGWARLAAAVEDPIERYAYARVGYHRGLDALRAAGWGGRGYVRWAEPDNRGVLTCLARLRDAAAAIGEQAEVERLDAFLLDLDPDWSNDLAAD